VGGDFYDFIELGPEAHGGTLERAGEPLARGQAQPKGAAPALTRRDIELEFWRSGKIASRKVDGHASTAIAPGTMERLGIVIADVTDKGVPAALFMALSRTLIRATASDGRAPNSVLEQANRLILADARSGLFVTCFYGLLDFHTHMLTYADGGHNYPLHYRVATNKVEPLSAQGIVLGIVPEPRFEQHSTAIEPGDVICFYTDGVTEAMDARRQLFGEERLAEVLRRSHHLEPDDILNRIIDAVTNFSGSTPQADDITLVVLKRNA
jgi:serine phosphatase RsbU (regulator of sigma subunit)